MQNRLLVVAGALLVIAACDKKLAAPATPALMSDSVKTSAAVDLILAPNADQIAKAHRVGNLHCPTDGQKLGSMGAPLPVIFKGELVELCCAGCPSEFAKDPAKYLAIAKADAASK